jgi:hypothetical protein
MHLIYPYVQNAVGWLITFIAWPDRNLHICVQNNLKGHLKRNSKTAFMYMIAITFLLFAGTSFSLQRELLVAMLKMLLGSDLAGGILTSTEHLNEQGIRGYLNTQKDRGLVEEYTFISRGLAQMLSTDTSNYKYSVSISSLASTAIMLSPRVPAHKIVHLRPRVQLSPLR